jgi:hypothetical protein
VAEIAVASTNLDRGNRTMILIRSETSIQLTYTPKEYDEFNHALVAFRRELSTTLRDIIPSPDDNDREYFRTLSDEFIQSLDYIDRLIATRTEAGIQLTLNVQEFDKFDQNMGLLSMDLFGSKSGIVVGAHMKRRTPSTLFGSSRCPRIVYM